MMCSPVASVGLSMLASSVSVVEGVVGDQPSEGAVVAGDWFGDRSAWAVFGFVVEAVSQGEYMHFVVVELKRFPHGVAMRG